MVVRSCLCFSSTTKRYFFVSRFSKAHLFTPPKRMISSLAPEIKTTINNNKPPPLTPKTQLPLQPPPTPANKTCYYQQLQQLPSQDIYNVFLNHPDLKQARVMFKEASLLWNKETLQKLMLNETDPKYHWWKLDLFKALVADYRLTHDLDSLLDSIPLDGPLTTLIPLYNSVLRASLKQNRPDHTKRVLDIMKERKVTPDIASYNIIMGSQLNQQDKVTTATDNDNDNDDNDANDLYQTCIIGNHVKPNQATFNMLIKHACDRKNWDGVQKWLDEMMDMNGLEANEITARILFKVFVKHPDNATLTNAFERVMDKVELKETERFVNTGVSALLEADRLDSALKLLEKNKYNVYDGSSSTSNRSYNLLIQALCRQGELEHAQDVLDRMIHDENIPKPDVVTFTTLIHGLIRHNHHHHRMDLEKITVLYQQMIDLGIRSNSVLESVLLYGLTKYRNSSTSLKHVQSLFKFILRESSKTRLPRQDTDRPLALVNIYNIMMDFYFLHYHENKLLKETMPTQPFMLLKHALDHNIKPTTTTLNILVRGTALFNHDLNTAERIVQVLTEKQHIKMDERTLWYLAKSAVHQGQLERGREWIEQYEKDGHEIKGTGLLALRSTLMKYHKDNV